MNRDANQNQQLCLSIPTCILPLACETTQERTRFVQSFAVLSCFFLSLLYSLAICATSGSSGLGSHSNAKIYSSVVLPQVHTLNKTFPIVNAGDLHQLLSVECVCVPCIFEGIETDVSSFVDVAMIDLGLEANLRRTEGICLREIDIK